MLAFPPLFTPPTNLVYTFDDSTTYHNDLHTQPFNPHHFTNDHQQEEPTHPNLDPYSRDDLLFLPFDQEALPPPLVQTYMGGAQMSPPGASSGCSPLVATMVEEKKLSHNASERNRRKRVNSLYASLRALLPFADQTKKLSIPGTVAKVLNYIPKLQSEVEGLIHRKEGLLPNTTTTTNYTSPSSATSSCSVQATQLGSGEISIQIAAIKSIQTFFATSEILQELEEEGVTVVDVSSSESPAGRVFHHIHIMVLEARHDIECDVLKEKLLSLCQEREKTSSWVN